MVAPKICIFTETYYPVVGGGETQAQLLAEGLVAHGFPVILLTRRSDVSLEKVKQYGDITVHRLSPVGGGQLKKWGLILSSLPALIKLRNEYDLIFVSGYRIVGMTAVLIAKLLGKKVVLKADSQGEMSGKFFIDGLAKFNIPPSSIFFRTFLWLRNKIIKRADAFVAISSSIANELTDFCVSPTLIYQIPNGVDIDRFYPVDEVQKRELRKKLNLPLEGKFIIFTGRLVSYKGLPLLVRVWSSIQSKYKNVHLILVGSGGLDIHNCEEELLEFVEVNALQDTVLFTGNVENVHEYLQASDIFVFPTENEAFGISLIEAMACCLPVVTTNVGAIKTIVNNGRNGICIEPGNYQQLHQALELVLNSPKLVSQLGKSGWHTVRMQFSAGIVTEKYVELFARFFDPKGGAFIEAKEWSDHQ